MGGDGDPVRNSLILQLGKLNTSHGFNSKVSTNRVPFNHIDCHPVDANKFLLVGGSIVTINVLCGGDAAITSLNPNRDSYNSNIDEISRELYSTPVACPYNVKRLFSYSAHAPNILTRASFNSTGSLVLVVDMNKVSIWQLEQNITFSEYNGHDIFDACFLSDRYVAIATIGQLQISLAENFEIVRTITVENQLFIKGLAVAKNARPFSFNDTNGKIFRIAIMTNGTFAGVYEQWLPDEFDQNIIIPAGRWLYVVPPRFFLSLTNDIPLNKIPSFSSTGHLVAFPFAERRSFPFALVQDLNMLPDPYRVRGHQSTVNCSIFSNKQISNIVKVDKLLLSSLNSESSKIIDASVKAHILSLITDNFSKLSDFSSKQVMFLFAASSTDGCVSVWLIIVSQMGSELSASCIFATPNSIVDQTAVITSMSWSNDDNYLFISSDDGKMMLIEFIWTLDQ